jgi:hypothetical protein
MSQEYKTINLKNLIIDYDDGSHLFFSDTPEYQTYLKDNSVMIEKNFEAYSMYDEDMNQYYLSVQTPKIYMVYKNTHCPSSEEVCSITFNFKLNKITVQN